MIIWAGQGFTPGVRAWYDGDAVAVASPELSKRDRLAVVGPVEDVARLVAKVYAEVGTTFRPFGEEHLIRHLVDRVPGLEFGAAFGWMDTRTAPTHQGGEPAGSHAQAAPQADRGDGLVSAGGPAWLDGDDGVEALLKEAAPSSYAWPGHPAVRRWAAATGDRAELLSVAADAWSAPEIGFLAGVATRPVARGKGLAYRVCAFVTSELVKRHGQAGLMVDGDNAAAISVYRRLGYAYRPVAAAHM
ncbi:FR47-like protein [Kribbella antiqua]|uniref:FR47-like protein n=2 Tax=Kribbella antiqua TaxID=2512217 RepID=A0A4R2IUH5_9ACTN|nr:FR47-like protein [Kribbella antiqua]